MGRPRLQFRLRTLLIVMTLIAIGVGYFGVRWYRQYQRQQAIELVRGAGGKIVQNESQEVVRIYFGGEYFGDEALRQMATPLRRIPELRELDLVKVSVTDQGVESLAGLYQLEELYLFETPISDQGKKRIGELLPQVTVKNEQPDPIATGLAAMNIYPHAMVAIGWSPDGDRLATGSGNGQVRLWRRNAELPWADWPAHSVWAFDVAFSPDGALLATGGGDGAVRLWEADSQRLVAELMGHTDDVHAVAFAAAGKTVVSAGDDWTLRLWDLASRDSRQTLVGHEGPIPAIAISPDGRRIASASRDGTARLWDVATGEQVALLKGHADDVMGVAFSPRGDRLATASYDGSVRLWELDTYQTVQTLRGHAGRVYCAAFDPTGQLLATGGADGVRLWDLAAGESRAAEDQTQVAKLSFAPDGRALVSTNADGELRWLDTNSGATLRIIRTAYGERGLMLPVTMRFDHEP